MLTGRRLLFLNCWLIFERFFCLFFLIIHSFSINLTLAFSLTCGVNALGEWPFIFFYHAVCIFCDLVSCDGFCNVVSVFVKPRVYSRVEFFTEGEKMIKLHFSFTVRFYTRYRYTFLWPAKRKICLLTILYRYCMGQCDTSPQPAAWVWSITQPVNHRGAHIAGWKVISCCLVERQTILLFPFSIFSPLARKGHVASGNGRALKIHIGCFQ